MKIKIKQIIQILILIYSNLKSTIQGLQEIDNLSLLQEIPNGAGQNIRFDDSFFGQDRHPTALVPFDDNIYGIVYYRGTNVNAAFIQGGQLIDDEVEIIQNSSYSGLGACKVNQDQMFVLYTNPGQLNSRMVTKLGGTVQLQGAAVVANNVGIDQKCLQLQPDLIAVVYMNTGDDPASTGIHPWGVYLKTYTISTQTYSAAILINNVVVGFQSSPDIRMLDNGRVVVAFQSNQATANINRKSIYIQDLDNTGSIPGGSTNQLVARDTTNLNLNLCSTYTDGTNYYIGWVSEFQSVFRRYDNNLLQQCELIVGPSTFSAFAVYDNIAYFRYYDDQNSYVAEIFTNNCTFKSHPRLETNTRYRLHEDIVISISTDRVTLAYLQTGPAGATAPLRFSEYLIEEFNNQCTDTQECKGCFGSYTCNTCNGPSDEQIALKRKDTGDCRCIDGYFFNNVSQNCEQCHYKCATCTAFDTCVLCSDSTRVQLSNCICQDGYYDDGIYPLCVANNRCLVPQDFAYNIQTAGGIPQVSGHLPSASNNAYQFDGSTSLDIGTQTFGREISISFWARFDVFNQNSRIFDCGTGHGVNNLIIQNVGTTGQLMVQYFRDSQSNLQLSSENAILNQWEDWVVTIDDNGDINIYKNGVLGNTNESYTNKRFRKEQRSNCFIARPNNPVDSNFQGELEQLRIYYRVLSSQEIKCISDQNGYCEHQCGSCSTTPESCDTCSDTNRDLASQCQCNDGFINFQTRPQCQINQKSPADFVLEGRDSQNFGTTDGPGVLENSNSAMVFNGDGNYRDFGITNVGGDVTASAWVKFEILRKNSRIMDFGNDAGTSNIVVYNFLYTNQICFAAFDNSDGYWQCGGRAIIGEWVHVLVTKPAGAQARIYINGVDTSSTSGGNSANTIEQINRTMSWIGRSHWEVTNLEDWFQGSIDNWRLYERILTNNEIQYLNDIKTYCNRECLYCQNTMSQCTQCIGENRNLANNCRCNTGFYDDGSLHCKPILPCQTRQSQLGVLATDGTTPQGKLFHFNRAQLDTILNRNDWDSNMFNVLNLRTGQIKQIVVFTALNGGSLGDASGRLEPEVNEFEFRVGDILEFMGAAQCQSCQGLNRQLPYCTCIQGYYEIEGQDDCVQIQDTCQEFDTKIEALSVDSGQDANPGFTTGMNINFNADQLDRILKSTTWDQQILKFTNMRTGYRDNIQLFRLTTNGGTLGDSYGRLTDNDPLRYQPMFQTNDILDLQIQSTCIQCQGDYRRLPNCYCAFGYEENLGNCQRSIPTTTKPCSNFIHMESKTGSSGYLRIYINNVEISPLPLNGSSNQNGITLIILNKDTLEIISQTIYDIRNVPTDDTQLQSDISALADEVVLVGIMDTDLLVDVSAASIAALKSLGAGQNLQISPKSSYLLIGQKGAQEGSRPEWYESEFPQINSINLYQNSNENTSYLASCIDPSFITTTPTNFHAYTELTLFDGVTAFQDTDTLPNLIKYSNIPNDLQQGIFIQGDQILQNTMDCTLNIQNQYADAYIFIENQYEETIYKTNLQDGDLEQILLSQGWSKLPISEQTMVQINVNENTTKKMTIFKQSFTQQFIFPQIGEQEFTGGISIQTKECHGSCATCTGSAENQCTTCIPVQLRNFDSTTNTCNCKLNSDNNFALQNSYICECIPGYYLNAGLCKKCDRKCGTCGPDGVTCIIPCESNCGYCDITGKCIKCLAGFYLDDNKECIQQCHNKCVFCSGQQDKCLLCAKGIGRSNDIEQQCSCIDGYYETSSGSKDCLPCKVRGCRKCDSNGLCLQCTNRLLDPKNCIQKSVLSQEEEIPFIVDDNGENKCKIGLNRSDQYPCKCNQGYYSVLNSMNCKKCPQECVSCINEDTCTQCIEDRVLNKFTNLCQCQKGYKEDQNGICRPCYNFKGKCFYECPENTKKNQNLQICEQNNMYTSDNYLIIYVCWTVAFIITMFLIIIVNYKFNKFTKQYNNDQGNTNILQQYKIE